MQPCYAAGGAGGMPPPPPKKFLGCPEIESGGVWQIHVYVADYPTLVFRIRAFLNLAHVIVNWNKYHSYKTSSSGGGIPVRPPSV